MSILAKIFGSSDVISKGLDLIDSFHTSETESIEAKAKAKTDLLKAYAPFKIAQRYLAFMFGGTFLLSFLLVLGMTLFYEVESVLMPGVDAAAAAAMATAMTEAKITAVRMVLSEFYIGEIMLTIIVFYFGGGFAEGALNSRKGK